MMILKYVCYICIMKINYLFLSVLFFFSCTQYRLHQKVLKSTDPEFQYTQAVNYFTNKDYARALQIFENLLVEFKGSDKAESIYYHYIYCNYHLKDYVSASFHANNFVSKFLLSSKNEEIAFLRAYCYYLDTPRQSLDQVKTYDAIEQLESFIMNYPTSDSLSRINDLIFDLNRKLEKKFFDNAVLYYHTGKYKSAIYAIDNYLKQFPETTFSEEISFIQLKSYVQLGKNSIEEKKEQRIKEAIFASNNFLMSFPDSDYIQEVKDIYETLKTIQNGL